MVIAWQQVVDKPYAKPRHVGKPRHAEKELTAVSVAFRPVVQIDDKLSQAGKLLLSFFPPHKNAVNHKVAGFVVGAEKQK